MRAEHRVLLLRGDPGPGLALARDFIADIGLAETMPIPITTPIRD
jgi:hypothetical protein